MSDLDQRPPGAPESFAAPYPLNRPASAEGLHGIGPRQAAVLREYGIHSVGLLAAAEPATVQRLLGGRAGQTAPDRARGIESWPEDELTEGMSRGRLQRFLEARAIPSEHGPATWRDWHGMNPARRCP